MGARYNFVVHNLSTFPTTQSDTLTSMVIFRNNEPCHQPCVLYHYLEELTFMDTTTKICVGTLLIFSITWLSMTHSRKAWRPLANVPCCTALVHSNYEWVCYFLSQSLTVELNQKYSFIPVLNTVVDSWEYHGQHFFTVPLLLGKYVQCCLSSIVRDVTNCYGCTCLTNWWHHFTEWIVCRGRQHPLIRCSRRNTRQNEEIHLVDMFIKKAPSFGTRWTRWEAKPRSWAHNAKQ